VDGSIQPMVDRPLLSIITNVTRDHERSWEIPSQDCGREAGIIKKGRPLITAATHRGSFNSLPTLPGKKAPLYRVGKDFRYEPIGAKSFITKGPSKAWGLHLGSPRCFINSINATRHWEPWSVGGSGLSCFDGSNGRRAPGGPVPGRLEEVSSSPRVVLDGAHNPDGARALKESLEREFPFQRLIVLLGIMKDKTFHRSFGPWRLSRIALFSPNPIRIGLFSSPSSWRPWEGMGRRRRSSRLFLRPLKRGYL